jgi:hypothetical protein
MSPAPQKRMGKLRASYLLAAESFELFRKDAEIVWFVVFEALIMFALIVAALSGFAWLTFTETIVIPEEGDTSLGLETLGYAVLFVGYLVGAYITTYFGVALTSVVAARIEGEDKNLRDGIRAANERAGKIFAWSLLSSTVGLILQIIADKASWAGKVFSWLGGVAWGVATFFIVPVLARENESVVGSVKRSGQTFVSTWGEAIIMNFSLGLFFGMLHIALLVLFGIGLLGVVTAAEPIHIVFVLALWAAFILLFTVLALMHSVLNKVFRVVLYEYATRGTIPDSFTPELIMGALSRKEAKTAA